MVAGGDDAHRGALKHMKGRWKHPIKGMGWYKSTKREFAALPEDCAAPPALPSAPWPAILRGAIERHDGFVFSTGGDGFCAAFSSGAMISRRPHRQLDA